MAKNSSHLAEPTLPGGLCALSWNTWRRTWLPETLWSFTDAPEFTGLKDIFLQDAYDTEGWRLESPIQIYYTGLWRDIILLTAYSGKMNCVALSQKPNVSALTADRGAMLQRANTLILLHRPVNHGHSKLLELGLDLICPSATPYHHHTKWFPSLPWTVHATQLYCLKVIPWVSLGIFLRIKLIRTLIRLMQAWNVSSVGFATNKLCNKMWNNPLTLENLSFSQL